MIHVSARRTMAGAILAGLATVTVAVPAAASPSPSAPAPAAPAPHVTCATPATQRVPQKPWAQAALAPERAWDLTDGRGVVVAVLGTGVDASVPQLRGHVERGRDVAISPTTGGRADTDCVGTGTFAAGIVAAKRVDGVGMTGVAPGATLLPVRVARDGVDASAPGVAAGIDAAVAGGARVISVAVKPMAGSPELARAVRDAIARDVVVVAPAGDTNGDTRGRFFPAAYPDVLSVAATDQSGTPVAKADKSAGVRVDLAAPGKDLVSLGTGGPGQLVGSGNEYAAAFVAGSAALVRAYHPALSAADVKRRLENTATRPGTPVPDPSVGWGVVNPYESVSSIMTLGGNGGTAPRVTLPPHVVADRRPGRLALLLIVGIGVAVVAVGVAAAVIRAGQRRGWQAGALPRE